MVDLFRVRSSQALTTYGAGLLSVATVLVAITLVTYSGGIRNTEIPVLAMRLGDSLHDLAVVSLVFVAAIGFGALTLVGLGFEVSDPEYWLYSIVVGLGEMALLVLLLAAMHWLRPVFLIALTASGVLAAGLGTARLSVRPALFAVRQAAIDIGRDPLSVIAMFFSLTTLAYSWLVNAVPPPTTWDSLLYHLGVPKLYLANSGLIYIPYIVHSNWPFNVEMLYTLTLGVGTERTPGVLAFAILLAGCVGLILWCRRVWNTRVGVLGASFCLSIPVIFQFAGTATVDIVIAIWSFLGVAAWLQWLELRDRKWLILAGLIAGFAAGSKLSAASTGLFLGLATALASGIRLRSTRAILDVVWFGATGLLVVLPWYVRSWIVTGNPVWPFLFGVFPSRSWDAVGDAALTAWLLHFGTGTSIASALSLPWNLFMSTDLSGRLGPLSLVLVLVAVLVRTRDQKLLLLLGYTVFSCTAWFFSSQQLRLLSPVLICVSVFAALGAEILISRPQEFGRLVLTLGLAGWLLTQSPFVVAATPLESVTAYVRGATDRDEFLASRIRPYPVFQYANNHLPENAQIFIVYYENRGFYLDRRFFAANPVTQRLVQFDRIGSANQLQSQLLALGMTHVIVSQTPDYSDFPGRSFSQHMHQIVEQYSSQYLTQIFEANGITLYAIKGAS